VIGGARAALEGDRLGKRPRVGHNGGVRIALAAAALATLAGCHDVSRYASHGDGFEGPVVAGSFVRSGVTADARMCLMFDTDHLEDAPGTISTTDGRFTATPLRPIPQVLHDPLSTLTFGEGRVRNLLYAATPSDGPDVLVVLSLMKSGGIEARVLRGAPQPDAGVASTASPPMFAIFNLERRLDQPCKP
jgi:hypothetical protein